MKKRHETTITFRVRHSMKDQLAKFAAKNETSAGEVVRLAVDRFLNN
tara:strand:+ start:322 stop:462 length:141 start_codon:yes stop_codon:yes gene_type:complete